MILVWGKIISHTKGVLATHANSQSYPALSVDAEFLFKDLGGIVCHFVNCCLAYSWGYVLCR